MTIRKYTPPTCTLEVTTQTPWFSRLRGQEVLEDLQFQLSFDDPRLPQDEYITVNGDRTQLSDLCQAVSHYVQYFLSSTPILSGTEDNKPDFKLPDFEIYVKPDSLLYHDLFLGSLATETSGPYVHLSALQLFDLATALQECTTEFDKIPVAEPFNFQPLVGLRTLLMIFISIGALTGLIKLVGQYRNPQIITATPEPEEETVRPPNLTPPALPTWPSPPPAPSPSPSPKIAANLPGVDTVPLAVPPPLFPSVSSPPPPEAIPGVSQQAGGLIIIPTEPPQPTSQPVPPPASQPIPQGTPAPVASVPVAPQPAPPTAPVSAPPVVAPNPIEVAPPVIELPPLQNREPPQIVSIYPIETEAEPGETVEPNPSEAEASNDVAKLNKRPEKIAATRSQEVSLFDEIPQVNQVRTYFLENWYPPKSLQRSLQYSLQLNADGSIHSITPIGQPSINRIQELTLPSAGEPFVSPTEDGRYPKIRVVLEPSGRVKTFLESLNNSAPAPVVNNL